MLTLDFGLFDTLGNAYEWCDNLFLEYEPAKDSAVEDAPHATPLAPDDRLVLRGGAFFTLPVGLRSAVRSDSPPGQRANDVGFRPVRTLP
jgi:formylglycine-generating enzyme required for sulfatase activity